MEIMRVFLKAKKSWHKNRKIRACAIVWDKKGEIRVPISKCRMLNKFEGEISRKKNWTEEKSGRSKKNH